MNSILAGRPVRGRWPRRLWLATSIAVLTGVLPGSHYATTSPRQPPEFFVLTVVGGGLVGDGGPLLEAGLGPVGIATDAAGNIYIADHANARIRAANRQAVDLVVGSVTIAPGEIETIAGTREAGAVVEGVDATTTPIPNPRRVAVDSAGNVYFVESFMPRKVFRIDKAGGIVTRVAGSGVIGDSPDGTLAVDADFGRITDIKVTADNLLLMADQFANKIRTVDLNASNPTVQTLIGTGAAIDAPDGPITAASSIRLRSMALDSSGTNVLVSTLSNTLRYINRGLAPVTFFSGSASPVTVASGEIRTLAGGFMTNAIALDAAQNIFLSQFSFLGRAIRSIDFVSGATTTLIGDLAAEGFTPDGSPVGPGDPLAFNVEARIAVSPASGTFPASAELLFVDGALIRSLTAPTTLTTIVGNGFVGFSGDDKLAYTAALGGPIDVAIAASSGNIVVADSGNNRVFEVNDISGDPTFGILTTLVGAGGIPQNDGDGGVPSAADIFNPTAVALDAADNVYIGTATGGIRVINRQVPASLLIVGPTPIAAGTINTVAGTATVGNISGIDVDAFGRIYWIERFSSRRLRVISPVDAMIAGVDVVANTVTTLKSGLKFPEAIVVHPITGDIFIAESFSGDRVIRIDFGTGAVSVVAGTGVAGFNGDGVATDSRLSRPAGISLDASGRLIVADFGNSRIRRVNLGTNMIETIGGNGVRAFAGDGGDALAASFNLGGLGGGVFVDSQGRILVSDTNNGRIRRMSGPNITVTGPVTVTPVPGITFEFDNVTDPGFLSVTTGFEGPPIGPDFTVGTNPNNRIFYFVDAATADPVTFTGTVTVRIQYDDEFSGPSEQNVKLRQFKPPWKDITDTGFPDIVANIVQGTTDVLSVFKVTANIALPVDISVDPEVIKINGGVYTVAISPPQGFSANDIDLASITANGFPPRSIRRTPQFAIAQFDRTGITDIGGGFGEILVGGTLIDGTSIQGSAIVAIK